MDFSKLERVALTVRMLAVDAVEKANSGHPGLPLGAADFATVLWAKYLRFDPRNPSWANRDRFVLSAGHGCALVYALLHLFGYDLSLEEVKSFRQWGSKTPGHPEFGVTPGVEATTGPLGQGTGNSVGMALSGKLLAAEYGAELFDHRVIALVSDGDLMEGISSESASIAGHLALNNLIWVYDDNKISLAGPTSVCFSEDIPKRFEAMGWWAASVDGHDMRAFSQCMDEALKVQDRPKIICARTTIGFGSPNKAGHFDVHGSPLGADELKKTKENLGWPSDKSFFIPEEVKAFLADLIEEKRRYVGGYEERFSAWVKQNGELAAKLKTQLSRTLPGDLKQALLATFKEPKKDATRNLSGQAIQTIARKVPFFIGGSADLEPSTKTSIKGSPEIQAESFKGRNLRFGVREHGMGAVANGLAYSRAWVPFTATFLTFSDYMRPTLRLAALSELQTLFIFTHDSVYLGEDGPTHQPVEHAMALRAIPNLLVFRPADGIEVAMSYYAALSHQHGPSALLFTRQNLPALERRPGFNPDEILNGAYIVSGEEVSDLILVATGSEVSLAVEVAAKLKAAGKAARVVSMPCMELFLKLDDAKRAALIPPRARKVSLEAGITMGWERIVGLDGVRIGIDRFGASAPAEVLAKELGLSVSAVYARIVGDLNVP